MSGVKCEKIEFVYEVNDLDLIEKNNHYINSLVRKAECNTLEDIIAVLDGLDGLERTTTTNTKEVRYLVREGF